MSNPDNTAARNTMSEFERQCYDWGWADAEERIIKLIEDNTMTMTSPLDNSVMRSLRISPRDLIALIKNFGE